MGILLGTEVVLRHSQIGTDVLPSLGNLMADGMAALHLELEPARHAGKTNGAPASMEGFRTNGWQIEVAEFQRRIARVPAEVATNLTARLQAKVSAYSPALATGLNNRLTVELINRLVSALIESKAESELARVGALPLYRAVRHGLPAAAAKSEPAGFLARDQLSTHLIQQGLIPTVMAPVRSLVQVNILVFALLAIVAAVGPLLCLGRVLRRLRCSTDVSPVSSPCGSRGG